VVGVVSGYCFAGNAAMLGCCDVIIATKDASIGMGGPAMIEGGGLGVYHPAEVGPVSFQAPNGVIDILVEDEEEATRVAQQYLSYFQGPVTQWQAHDQRLLRRAIPENRLRVYDIRSVIDLLADEGSVLEIRRDFGNGRLSRTTLHDLTGAAVQLDHAFRKQQHVSALDGFPLQSETVTDGRAGRLMDGLAAHAGTA